MNDFEFKEVSSRHELDQFVDLIKVAVKIYSDNAAACGYIGHDANNGWCDENGIFVPEFVDESVNNLAVISKKIGFKSMFVAKKINSRFVVGALWVRPAQIYHTVYFSFISVKDEFRMKGIGKNLHAYASNYYKRLGWRIIIEAQPQNEAAIRCMKSGSRLVDPNVDFAQIKYLDLPAKIKE